MVRLGLSPETPVACQQWSGLIAINYPARSYGITRHMTVQEVSLFLHACFYLLVILKTCLLF